MRMIQLNSALFGGYLLVNGPMKLMYRKFLTLDSDSAFTSLGLCHFAHTSALSFFVNSAALWTLGNYTARRHGCSHFSTVLGISMATASVLGAVYVRNNNE